MAHELKNVSVVVEDSTGVCVWQLADGAYIADEDNNLLSAFGELNDPRIEEKMRQAAVSYLGDEARLGHPVWVPGSRKISDEEYEEQVARLEEGLIPDPVDEAKQILEIARK